MDRHPILRAGLYPLVAAGTLLSVGGLAPPATAAPPSVSAGLPQDCDVIGGQPGGQHGPGGHDDHFGGQAAPSDGDHSQMDHSQMDHSQMSDGQMDHGQMDHGQMGDAAGGHGSHGASTIAAPPTSGTRTLVLGGFGAVNAMVLGAAGVARRRTGSRRRRQLSARTVARPARRVTEADER